MPLPDPFAVLAAAAEHVRQGVPEAEAEWSWEAPDGSQERLTFTLRRICRHEALANVRQILPPLDIPPPIPDTPEGIE